ncbi:MAG: hypothetical protein KDD33_13405, partial [Bdellovibrionales bacterium]|nr:hypothetical protein [Bdellovibrionales bacterium]
MKVGSGAGDAKETTEYYKDRERRIRDQHRDQIDGLKRRQTDRVNQINADHAKNIKKLKGDQENRVSKKDIFYQSEIDRLKKAHQEFKRQESASRSQSHRTIQEENRHSMEKLTDNFKNESLEQKQKLQKNHFQDMELQRSIH